jgi:phosphoglycolate phosphatase-like HAD superfamily hydrolase
MKTECNCKSQLTSMWEIQRSFYEIIREEKSHMSDQEFCHAVILHLHNEVSELLDAVGGPWKLHVNESSAIRKSQVLAEAVDITKLTWEVAIAAGVTADEFYDAFMQKSAIVEERRRCESFLKTPEQQKATVVFDMDGVLVYYPEYFLEFVDKAMLSTPWWPGVKKVEELKSPDDLWTQLGMSLEKYQELKTAFVEDGGLLQLPPVMEALELVDDLRTAGYAVVIVTSRDKSSLEKMELDSYKWLQKYDVRVNGIYFTLDKARFIKKNFNNVTMVVDDHALEVERMKEAGIPAVCLDRPYNRDGYGKRSGTCFEAIRKVLLNG